MLCLSRSKVSGWMVDWNRHDVTEVEGRNACHFRVGGFLRDDLAECPVLSRLSVCW